MIAAGDPDAFRAFYDRYGGRISAYLRHLGARGGEIEDLLQDVFLAVWHRASTFDARRGVAAGWLFTIARNKWFDRLRRPDRHATSPLEVDPVQPTKRVAAETRLTIFQALGRLKEEQRDAVELAYFGGLTYEETARELDLPLGTLKSRVRTGLRTLKAHLEAR